MYRPHYRILNGQFQVALSWYFYVGALIKYTFILFCSTILKNFISKGGYHENRPGPRCPNQRRHFDPEGKLRQDPDLSQRPYGPKKIQMVTLAELSDLTIEQICELFGYKTRKSYYDIRRFVLQNNIGALMPKKTGPKSAPKRTPGLEKRVIQLRLSTDKNMYDMTPILNREGFPIKARLVGQILSDYGISKKNRSQRSKRTVPGSVDSRDY